MLKASEFLNPPKPTLSGRLVSNSGEEMLSRFQLRERRDLRIVEDFKAGKRLDELADLYRIGEGRVRIILKEHGCDGRQK